MATKSTIEWTESTWNPVTGCSKISPGCKNCYAERMAKRLHAMGQPNYRNGFEVTMHPHALELPLAWKKPQTIFVNSMSDLFHEDVSEDFILKVFETMNKADWHRYQILTKRSERMVAMNEILPHSAHIWLGVTVENADYKKRIDDLRKMNSEVKFISFEPLLGRLGRLNLKGIDWAIVGGESGPGARPIKEDWILEIKDQCDEQKVPFFFKQWGGVRKKKNGRELLNQTWDAMPKAISA
jgi:protein gp37